MKKFLKVTVNGTSYDVMVEDVKEGSVVEPASVVSAPVQTTPAAVEAPKQEEKTQPVSSGSGDIKVTAPMPGNIWKIKTSVGAKVNKHDVLLILEAMKMENEIVAPEAGTVTSILVKEGDSVEPGKILVELS